MAKFSEIKYFSKPTEQLEWLNNKAIPVFLMYVSFYQAGVENGGMAWGAAFVDFNNDGFLDFISTSGKYKAYHLQANILVDYRIILCTFSQIIRYRTNTLLAATASFPRFCFCFVFSFLASLFSAL